MRVVLPVVTFFLGFFVAGIFMSQQMQRRSAQDPAVAVNDEGIAMQRVFDQLRECNARFQTWTILYEPGAEPSLPFFNGALSIQANMPVQAGPKWIVPAKIEPVVSAASPNFTYSYFNIHTRKLDGPYLPETAAEKSQQLAAQAQQQAAAPPQGAPAQPVTNSRWPN